MSILWTADGTKSINQEWASLHTTENCAAATTPGMKDSNFYAVDDPQAPHGRAWVADKQFPDHGPGGCYSYGSPCRFEAGMGNVSKRFADGVDREFTEGQDVWLSFAIKLDKNWPTKRNGGVLHDGGTVIQFTHPDGSGGPTHGLSVEIRSSNGECHWWWWGYALSGNGGKFNVDLGSAENTAGSYVKFTAHIKATSSSNGVFELFSDLASPGGSMALVASAYNRNTIIRKSFMTFGIYCWNNASTHYQTMPQVMSMAGLTCATTRAEAETHAFGGSPAPTPPPTPPPAPLTAQFTTSPAQSKVGEVVHFDGSASVSANHYAWSDASNNAALGTGQHLDFAFRFAGTKKVKLTVTDANGNRASVEHDHVVA